MKKENYDLCQLLEQRKTYFETDNVNDEDLVELKSEANEEYIQKLYFMFISKYFHEALEEKILNVKSKNELNKISVGFDLSKGYRGQDTWKVWYKEPYCYDSPFTMRFKTGAEEYISDAGFRIHMAEKVIEFNTFIDFCDFMKQRFSLYGIECEIPDFTGMPNYTWDKNIIITGDIEQLINMMYTEQQAYLYNNGNENNKRSKK